MHTHRLAHTSPCQLLHSCCFPAAPLPKTTHTLCQRIKGNKPVQHQQRSDSLAHAPCRSCSLSVNADHSGNKVSMGAVQHATVAHTTTRLLAMLQGLAPGAHGSVHHHHAARATRTKKAGHTGACPIRVASMHTTLAVRNDTDWSSRVPGGPSNTTPASLAGRSVVGAQHKELNRHCTQPACLTRRTAPSICNAPAPRDQTCAGRSPTSGHDWCRTAYDSQCDSNTRTRPPALACETIKHTIRVLQQALTRSLCQGATVGRGLSGVRRGQDSTRCCQRAGQGQPAVGAAWHAWAPQNLLPGASMPRRCREQRYNVTGTAGWGSKTTWTRSTALRHGTPNMAQPVRPSPTPSNPTALHPTTHPDAQGTCRVTGHAVAAPDAVAWELLIVVQTSLNRAHTFMQQATAPPWMVRLSQLQALQCVGGRPNLV